MDQATASRPGSEKVHLAVGDDMQCLIALQWARHFIPPQMPLVLVHIHRPTTMFPMFEKDLVRWLQICKVEAEIIIIDKDDVVVAILELIKEHNITTLVMGTKKSEHDWKSKTADALEKQADHHCNIIYLHNGFVVGSRHGLTNVHTARKSDIPSLGGCHFSSSNHTTTNKSSSFFNSCSTDDTFDSDQLNDPSLEMNSTYMYNDNRINAIFGLESFVTFRELVNQQNLSEHSKGLYLTSETKYCDILAGCPLISGYDSLIAADLQNLSEAYWKFVKSWPAVLEYIVSVVQLFKQNHRNAFTHNDLSEAAKKPIRHLFAVASLVSDDRVRKSPDKLFCVLNIYAALMDATPVLRKVFCIESISTAVDGVLAKLKDSVRGIVKELKGLIQNYNSQKVVQDGGILSISEYVMRYISLLVKHKGSLDKILDHDHTDDLLTAEGITLTSRLVFGLIADLESVIEKQSKSFASKGLQCIFLMNNMLFIRQEIMKSDVAWTVKEEWCVNNVSRGKVYIGKYLYASWEPVTSTLKVAKHIPANKRARVNILNLCYTGLTPLENFAASINETCNTQMCWKVPYPGLRDKLRAKILNIVTQAYHGYLESQKESVGQNAKDFEQELKSKISELFEG